MSVPELSAGVRDLREDVRTRAGLLLSGVLVSGKHSPSQRNVWVLTVYSERPFARQKEPECERLRLLPPLERRSASLAVGAAASWTAGHQGGLEAGCGGVLTFLTLK